jgi:hypothetical protein
MLDVMLRRMIGTPVALAHYTVGTVYVLVQLATYERNVRALHDGHPSEVAPSAH